MIDFEMAPNESSKGSSSRFVSFFETGLEDEPTNPPKEPFSLSTPVEELPDYLRNLNEPQRRAALTVDGPLIVLAGAGSGKTKMLTSRVAYLVGHCGVRPFQVLAVTFTNKAAKEMADRVQVALNSAGQGQNTSQPEIGTFHSVCVRLLRRELEATGFTQPFVIYDSSDSLALIKVVMKRLNIDPKNVNPKGVQGAIDRAKCDALQPEDMDDGAFNFFDKKVKEIYTVYQQELWRNNALDFGEIICLTYRILRDHPEIRKKYQNRYRYIHVDEYQDTNRAQYLLLSMLAKGESGGHENICVVGDEDQSIYAWRGADIQNILDFETDYPDASVVKLEQNYRSTKTIIQAASAVIANNSQRKDKELWTDNEEGAKIYHSHVADEKMESELVISEIKRLAESDGRSLEEFALFYRTHAQSRQFEDVLRRERIPYQIVGGLRFYDRKEIKDLIAYLKIILNPNDSISLKRVINVPARGIGKTTIEKLDELANEAAGDYWGTIERIVRGETELPARTTKKIQVFYELISALMRESQGVLLSELYHLVLDRTGYVVELKKEGTIEALARIENLEEFDTTLQEFEEEVFNRLKVDPESEDAAKVKAGLLPMFAEQCALGTQEDELPNVSAVKLMTYHGSKGLEFPFVFMVGMEEGLFPSVRHWEEEDEEEIEEERRLCYVGMTRAREKLYLTDAAVRRLWGNFNYQEPARFLSEIPSEFVVSTNLAQGGSGRSQQSSYSSTSDHRDAPSSGAITHTEADWIGRRIQHPEYGLGVIEKTDGSGAKQKVEVRFKGIGPKKFLLRFISQYLV